MSRSFRKNPWYTVYSNKWWKAKNHRRLRHEVRTILRTDQVIDEDGFSYLLPDLREISNIYTSNKDYLFRFDPKKDPHLARR